MKGVSRVIGSASNGSGSHGSALGESGPVPVLIAICMNNALFARCTFVVDRGFAKRVIADSLVGCGCTGVQSDV